MQLQTAILLMTLLLVPAAGTARAENAVTASYLYNLSDFTGVVPINWAGIAVDETVNEVYVINGSVVKIFNDSGMEIYTFNDGGELGSIVDAATDGRGDIFAIVYNPRTYAYEIIRCNYRGEDPSRIALRDLPAAFAGFSPDRIVYRGESLYLASLNAMKMIVTDRTGLFKEGHDLAALLGFDETKRSNTGMVGFSVDGGGNVLFTIGVTAKAYVLSPDRKIRSFGERGSGKGKFGVPGGIVADPTGSYLFVADTLRCIVLVFDRDLHFIMDFGGRGDTPGTLIGPMALAMDKANRLYVTQLAQRGISVYQISLATPQSAAQTAP